MTASWRILVIVAIIGICAPALPEPTPSAKKRDPNEIVCEKVKVSGSLVATRKVCGTRAEWAELRKREREMADQAQRWSNGDCQQVAMYPAKSSC